MSARVSLVLFLLSAGAFLCVIAAGLISLLQ